MKSLLLLLSFLLLPIQSAIAIDVGTATGSRKAGGKDVPLKHSVAYQLDNAEGLLAAPADPRMSLTTLTLGGSHLGVDWHLPVGTPIVAIADGDITAVIPETDPTSGPRGNTIIQTVEHGYALPIPGEIITASYTHLQGFNVSVNQRVRRGDVIGYLGQSGPNVGRARP